MIVNKRRIRSFAHNFPLLKVGQKFYLGINDLSRFEDKISKIGFSHMSSGQSVLPRQIFGPISIFNAEGKYIKNKKLPMEIAYREVEWHWKQWIGGGDTEEKSKIVYIPYKRYQRDFINPPSVEMTIFSKTDGSKLLVSPIMNYTDTNEKDIIHTVNLFLEIFGECQIFYDNLEQIVKIPVSRLNWRILPQGKLPWSRLKTELEPVLKEAGPVKRNVITNRIEMINEYGAKFCAIGDAGFHGYVVLGFPDKHIYLVESMYYGNATYVFEDEWRNLSKKTKAEILNKSLQKERIIHQDGWANKIDVLLK